MIVIVHDYDECDDCESVHQVFMKWIQVFKYDTTDWPAGCSSVQLLKSVQKVDPSAQV